MRTIRLPISFFFFVNLSFTIGFAQTTDPDSLLRAARNEKGVKKAEAYYSAIFYTLRINPDKAKQYINEYSKYASSESDPIIKAYDHLHHGIYQSAVGSADSAVNFMEEARRITGTKNNLLQIRIESSLGKIYIGKGQPEKGLESLFDALRVLAQSPDLESEIKVRINITWAYLELKRYRDCIQAGQVALTRVTPQYAWMLPYIYNNMAVSYGSLKIIDSARYYIEKSIPIAESRGDHNMIANAHFILGTIYSNSGEYQLAIDQYQLAKPHREKVGNPLFIVADQYTLSDLYAKAGNYKKGVDAGLEALRLAQQHHVLLKFEGVYEALAKNYAGLNDYQQASKYYNLWAQAKDSIYKNASAEAIAEMETKYETEKKELKIQEQQFKIERNQAITIGLVGVLVSLVIVAVLWRNQLKLREQRKFERHQRENQERLTKTVINLQEKERSRFAQDLHDGFGQLITALKIQFEKVGQRHDGISELIQHMHDEIRNVSFALSPQVLVRDGLVHALKELSFRINRSNTIKMNVQTTGFNERLQNDYEITLYRICQEWINNILKYSGASRIDVQLIEHSDEVVLMIEDDGKGFHLSALEKGSGNGWKNIQSRVQILNGDVEVDSNPERTGTTFTASIPISAASKSA